jgi:hypothetical protein
MTPYLESRKTGERYPFNPDLARHPDMFITDEKGEVPPEPAPDEPEMVRRPAAPKVGQTIEVAASVPPADFVPTPLTSSKK